MMVKLVLKHFMIEKAIEAFFEKLSQNFSSLSLVKYNDLEIVTLPSKNEYSFDGTPRIGIRYNGHVIKTNYTIELYQDLRAVHPDADTIFRETIKYEFFYNTGIWPHD